jgi:Fe-S-cluster-containing dehydrogenase component
MNSIATPRRNFFNRFAFARLLIPLRADRADGGRARCVQTNCASRLSASSSPWGVQICTKSARAFSEISSLRSD